MKKKSDEWMEVAYLGEVVTIGAVSGFSGAWLITVAGWGQSPSAEAAFGAICRRMDTTRSFMTLGEAKMAVEDGLTVLGVREWGLWKSLQTNRSDCNQGIRCVACGKKRNRWEAEAHKAKTSTGIGFFCKKPECLNLEPQKQLDF